MLHRLLACAFIASATAQSCSDLTGRTDLRSEGAFCYQIGNPNFASRPVYSYTCTGHYVASSSVTAGVHLCAVQPDGSCHGQTVITCPNAPELMNGMSFDALTANRTNLLTHHDTTTTPPTTPWCSNLDGPNSPYGSWCAPLFCPRTYANLFALPTRASPSLRFLLLTASLSIAHSLAASRTT